MKNNNEDKQTFWIAYADLMAGLLFVFILLIGGIIVKYVLTQNSLNNKENQFLLTLSALKSAEQQKKDIELLNKILNNKLKELNVSNKDLENKNSLFIIQVDELEKMVKNLELKNLDLNKSSTEKDSLINKNNNKIAFLLEQLTTKEEDINKILHDLNVTKNHIKNLTGVKVKVIASLKEKLGKNVLIDPNTGALILSSSVLFDKDSYELKEEAKANLEYILKNYFSTLLDVDEIRENLDQIVLEGHTDSDGSYLYNLELSQKRAFEVMKFISSWNKDERLKQYLIASGKSYISPIMKNGIEDKEASRRIEIKFTLSNKETIEEINKFLNYDNNATRN